MKSRDSKAASLAARLFGGRLTPDVIGDARRRLKIASLACFGAFALVLATHLILVHLGHSGLRRAHIIACLITMGFCILLFFMFGWKRLSPSQVINLAFIAEWQLCFSTSMMELNGPDPRHPDVFGISIACIIIVLAPSLIPAPPWKTLLVSLVCASTGLAALTRSWPWMVSLYGVVPKGWPPDHPPFIAYFNLYAVNFVCAGLALAPSYVIKGLRSELSEALELGSYRLITRLGQGGMGEVWSAQHRLLARPAAIKLIGQELAPDPVIRQRFEHEVQATAQLRCPHTVTVYDYGTTPEGTFYYVMELLDGMDMGTLVQKHGPLPPARVVFLLEQVLRSLQEAHDAGLVHRDIKPENVQVLPGDFVKVLDFGLALSIKLPADARLSTPDSVHGTPAFMAPEQALQKEVDGRADLYAVGCLGYWLLTGKSVFEADSPVAFIVAHVSQDPAPPGKQPELDALLLKALSKDPKDRPQSAAEMRKALPLQGDWTEDLADQWWKARV